jgi:hypothetical protein
MRPTLADAFLGLVVMPSIVVGILAIRGKTATPLRLDDTSPTLLTSPSRSGCSGCPYKSALSFNVQTAAWLFYGASMLLAAWRGLGACEQFVISNAPPTRRPARLPIVSPHRLRRAARRQT